MLFQLVRGLFPRFPYRWPSRLFLCLLVSIYITQSSESDIPANSPEFLLRKANALSWLNNWDAAGPLYAQAEALFRKEGKHAGELYARVGRIRAQETGVSWERVSSSLEAQLRDPVVQTNKDLRLWCLASRGYVDLDLNTASAKQSWTEALILAEELGKQQWAMRARGELGVIAFLEGDTATAVSLIGRALLSAFVSGDVGEQVRLLSMLGNGYYEVRRFKEALGFFQYAIAIAESTSNTGIPFMAYEGRATSLIGLGDYMSGRGLLEQALAKARAIHRRTEEAQTLILLGEASMSVGKGQEAKQYLEAGSRIAQESLYYRPLAQAMFDLFSLYRKEGSLPAAAASLSIALKASQRVGDKYYLPRDLAALAELKVGQKKLKEANRLFLAAEDAIDGLLRNAHSRIASRAMAESMSRLYFEHFQVLETDGDVSRAFETIERLRTRTTATHFLASQTSNSNRVPHQIASLQSDIARLQMSLIQADDERVRSGLLDKLLQMERSLAYEQNEEEVHGDVLDRPASLSQVQHHLREDEMLAEYVLNDQDSYSLVVTRENASIVRLPRGATDIKDLVAKYSDALKSKKPAPDPASQLYSILIQPIFRSDKPRLIIAADPALRSLPFEALKMPHGEFLVNVAVISYAPSASTVFFQRNSDVSAIAPRPLLAIGDVDYRGSSSGNTSVLRMIGRGLEALSGSRMSELPETRKEVLAIARIAGKGSHILLGKDASETAFKSEPLNEFRIIHLAAHALSDRDYPERASLILAVKPGGPDDGLLQVREIAYLHLKADLVTLSACETGVGGHAGVYSLQESFLISGARTVVGSIWNVEDRSTTTLMELFYTYLANGEDKASALAHAKRQFISQFGELPPYYWAGFVMLGDGASGIRMGDN